MKFVIDEVDPTDRDTQSVQMPHPWPALNASVSPQVSNLARSFKFAGYCAGAGELTNEILRVYGNGLIEPFSAIRFKPDIDVNREWQLKIVNAIEGLSLDFGGAMSAVVWNALASLGVPGYPCEPSRVVQVSDARFDGPGWATNAVLGAYFKTQDLKLHMDRCFALEAGAIPAYDPLGDFGAWHALGPVQKSSRPTLTPLQKRYMGLAFFANFLTEALSIARFKMPFVMRPAMIAE